jgi:primosomal protein N' (replication factor Y)
MVASEPMKRAPQQSALLKLLAQHPSGLGADQLNGWQKNWRQPMHALLRKKWVKLRRTPCLPSGTAVPNAPVALNRHQSEAVKAILAYRNRFTPFLLDGVTGSGKTEVYLEIVEAALAQGQQSLVLVPEIGLTPQLVGRFRARFDVPLAILHSDMAANERHCAWDMARSGSAPIVIGTRSAIFTPLAQPGMIIVDEEHDASFKQQDGFRYHARDLAVFRARQYGIPVILGSATPSLESVYNAKNNKYQALRLPERAGKAQSPSLQIIDLRRQTIDSGLSEPLLRQMHERLASEGQVLLFLNRRGYAPVLICHQCGWSAACDRCDAHMTLHARNQCLCCHHCGAERKPPRHCPNCGEAELRVAGEGTERVEQALQRHFAGIPIIRIDRDTTRRKGEMQSKLAQIQRGEHRILIGTQMLSKGHDFPEVTLVGIINVDQGLYSTDFRATERLAQLIVQVSGRAGRADKPGKVALQTHLPAHPLLETLLSGGYELFCSAALEERRIAGLPPYRHLALLRAEGVEQNAALKFLESMRSSCLLSNSPELEVWGPAPAPMERRNGRYRAQLLLMAKYRGLLRTQLKTCIQWLYSAPKARTVRWSLDVDPIDLY